MKQGELNVEPEIWANMFSIRTKIFGKVTGCPAYNQAPLQLTLPRIGRRRVNLCRRVSVSTVGRPHGLSLPMLSF